MIRPPIRIALGLMAVLALWGCKDDPTDVLSDEPTTSYCEAMCAWGVTCAGQERAVDPAALSADCLTRTRAADDGCAKAEDGSIDPAARKLLEDCVDDIESKEDAGECDAFIGRVDDMKASLTPESCAAASGADAQRVLNEAQGAVAEANEDLCQRFTDTFCQRVDECVLEDLGVDEIPSDVTAAVGGTPVELCVQNLSAVTDRCKSEGLYDPEEDLTDVNPTRQGARECLKSFDDVVCADLLDGKLPEVCAASFASAEDGASFACGLFDAAQAVIAEANGVPVDPCPNP